jgi:hypothetical protein
MPDTIAPSPTTSSAAKAMTDCSIWNRWEGASATWKAGSRDFPLKSSRSPSAGKAASLCWPPSGGHGAVVAASRRPAALSPQALLARRDIVRHRSGEAWQRIRDSPVDITLLFIRSRGEHARALSGGAGRDQAANFAYPSSLTCWKLKTSNPVAGNHRPTASRTKMLPTRKITNQPRYLSWCNFTASSCLM